MAATRYISAIDNLVLYTKGGVSKYKFQRGLLDLPTEIDVSTYTDEALELSYPHLVLTGANAGTRPTSPTDAEKKEMAGLGNLAIAANRLDAFRFYEAPILTATSGTVAAVADTVYIVIAGTVTYDGVTYKAGQTFLADGSTTATTGTGRYHLWFPESILQTPEQYSEEWFRIAHLPKPDDALSYYDQSGEYEGFEPQPLPFYRP